MHIPQVTEQIEYLKSGRAWLEQELLHAEHKGRSDHYVWLLTADLKWVNARLSQLVACV